jgi:2-polyprenyl-3-methyl-5-hydroxy-6-metoxy-1,4-benzoquinol methylase
MNTENITICPICENDHFEIYLEAKDYTVTHEEFELKKCSRCHFIITSPRPTAEAIGKYYASEKYISHSGKSKTLFDKIFLLARAITLRWKYEIIKPYISRTGTILDYGCGTGEFLKYVKDKGLHISGVEPNQVARQKANIKLDYKISETLEELNSEAVDIITLWHVLEHVHNLNETVQKLKNLLTQTGYFIIAVPNPKSHDCINYKNHWAGFDVPRHLWHFTQESMNSFLNKNGLNVVAIKPMKLDSFYVSLLSEGYKNAEQPKFITAMKAIIEGLISNLSARKTNEYSSLIYIARRQ